MNLAASSTSLRRVREVERSSVAARSPWDANQGHGHRLRGGIRSHRAIPDSFADLVGEKPAKAGVMFPVEGHQDTIDGSPHVCRNAPVDGRRLVTFLS